MTNQTRLGNPNITPGSLRDRAAQANAARMLKDTVDSQAESNRPDNEAETARLINRANAAKLSRIKNEPIPVNILGPDTFGP